jgi:hypothetical protein
MSFVTAALATNDSSDVWLDQSRDGERVAA